MSIGWGLLVIGYVALVVGVIWIHCTSLPLTTVVDGETVPVVVDNFNWIPRGDHLEGCRLSYGLCGLPDAGGRCRLPWVLNQR